MTRNGENSESQQFVSCRMKKVQYETASVTTTQEGAIKISSVAGIVTQRISRGIIADIVRMVPKQAAVLVNVVLHCDAVMAVSADSLFAAAVAAGVLASMPTALVVSKDEIGLWRQYAELAAASGMLRGIFLDYEDAHRWAARQAVVMQRWHDLNQRFSQAG